MLDQLVESKDNHVENSRKRKFVFTIALLAALSLMTAWTVSLFGKDFGMGGDDLALTTLVAPVPVRKELIQNMMQTPIKPPDTLSVTKNQVKEMRLDRMTKLGGSDSDTGAQVDPNAGRVVADGGTGGLSTSTGTGDTGGTGDEPPPPKAKPIPKTVSGGVLNGKATSLPKPAYPPAARAVRAGGSVSVQVLISETGSVLSASAVSGHPLLRPAAESAARSAHFSPTLLSGQPVKVSGVITYNFVP
jgi:protein TonB